MDTRTILEVAMIKCAVRFNSKDINAWCDTKTHGQLAKDLADQLYISGYCLQRYDPLQEEQTESEYTTNEGE
jgi:hypothetical protein